MMSNPDIHISQDSLVDEAEVSASTHSLSSPKSATQIACPLQAFGCSFQHSQSKRLIDHINGSHLDGCDHETAALLATYVTRHLATTQLCPCGRIMANTVYGVKQHRKKCNALRDQIRGIASIADDNTSHLRGMDADLVEDQLQLDGIDIQGSIIHTPNGELRIVDHGHQTTTDFNMCFYLSTTGGDEKAATTLKKQLGVRATLIALQQAVSKTDVTSYARRGILADRHVCLAYAQQFGPLGVLDLENKSAVQFSHADTNDNPGKLVVHIGEHFCELVPVEEDIGLSNLSLSPPASTPRAHDWFPDLIGNSSDSEEESPIAPPKHPPLSLSTITPRFSTIPSDDELKPLLTRIHLKSRALRALRPSHLWSDHMRETWSTECRRAAADLQVALNKETDLATVQAVMDVIELPSRVLARFVPTDNSNIKPKRDSFELPGEHSSKSNAHRRAEKLVFQDKYAKAMQELTSNGLADFSMETFEILNAMHPKRKKPLVKHLTSVAQVTVSTKKAKRLLFKTGGYNNTTLDVFGWSPDFLRPVRGDKVRFIQQLARLVARIACAEVPDCVGMILSCGGLFGLNKLTSTEQQERIKLGFKPKVRPVNVGVLFLKVAFKLVLKSPQVIQATLAMKHIQRGMGAMRGPEVMAHLARAYWERGIPQLMTDFTNGFNDFLRQAMLDAIERRCPAVTKLFNTFYARDSLCFFIVDGVVHIISSTEGSRMGCVLGSWGFCLTVQDIYEAVALRHGMNLRALTDDLQCAPELIAGKENLAIARCADAFATVRDEAWRRAGLKVNDKCMLLLPPGLTPPGTSYTTTLPADAIVLIDEFLLESGDDNHLDLDQSLLKLLGQLQIHKRAWPDGLVVEQTGMKIAGAPIGSDAYCQDEVAAALQRIAKPLKSLRGIDPSSWPRPDESLCELVSVVYHGSDASKVHNGPGITV